MNYFKKLLILNSSAVYADYNVNSVKVYLENEKIYELPEGVSSFQKMHFPMSYMYKHLNLTDDSKEGVEVLIKIINNNTSKGYKKENYGIKDIQVDGQNYTYYLERTKDTVEKSSSLPKLKVKKFKVFVNYENALNNALSEKLTEQMNQFLAQNEDTKNPKDTHIYCPTFVIKDSTLVAFTDGLLIRDFWGDKWTDRTKYLKIFIENKLGGGEDNKIGPLRYNDIIIKIKDVDKGTLECTEEIVINCRKPIPVPKPGQVPKPIINASGIPVPPAPPAPPAQPIPPAPPILMPQAVPGAKQGESVTKQLPDVVLELLNESHLIKPKSEHVQVHQPEIVNTEPKVTPKHTPVTNRKPSETDSETGSESGSESSSEEPVTKKGCKCYNKERKKTIGEKV